jgi:hypothetical protein
MIFSRADRVKGFSNNRIPPCGPWCHPFSRVSRHVDNSHLRSGVHEPQCELGAVHPFHHVYCQIQDYLIELTGISLNLLHVAACLVESYVLQRSAWIIISAFRIAN